METKIDLNTIHLGYDDVLIQPKFSKIVSRFSNEVNPYYDETKLPIVTAPMDTICSPEFIKKTKDKLYVVFSHRFQSIDEQIEHIKQGANGGVIGLNDSIDVVGRLIEAGAEHILLDVANGGNIQVVKKLESLQTLRKTIHLWAGNVTETTYDSISHLCDYVRCSIGSGAACETSTKTAIGCGAVTTILECRKLYSPGKAKIVADGGLKTNGDICKALAAGAHLVMLGRLFAGTEESSAEFYRTEKKIYKKYRGMASEQINIESGKTKYSVEGASGLIEYTGGVDYLIEQIDSNIRSSMSYVDATDLDEYYSNTKMIRVSNSAYNMAKPQI